jgi:hypothetical protein
MWLGTRQIELAQRNQVKNNFWTELRMIIIKTVDSVKKWPELRTAIIRVGSANLHFESVFSQRSKGN